MPWRILLIVSLMVIGCDRSPQPPSTPAQQCSAPTISSDPRLDYFIGEWMQFSEFSKTYYLLYTITKNDDGSVTVAMNPDVNQLWIFNNARFDGNALHCDAHFQVPPPEVKGCLVPRENPFTDEGNEIALMPTEDSDKLALQWTMQLKTQKQLDYNNFEFVRSKTPSKPTQ